MAHSEIDAIRALLGSKPRPVGWSERRERLDEVGSTWPVASDVKCEAVDCDGVAGEWSIVPGSVPSRVLLYFHGGGYCSGSIVSHRRLVTEAGRAARTRTLAINYRLAPEHPYPAAHEDALTAAVQSDGTWLVSWNQLGHELRHVIPREFSHVIIALSAIVIVLLFIAFRDRFPAQCAKGSSVSFFCLRVALPRALSPLSHRDGIARQTSKEWSIFLFFLSPLAEIVAAEAFSAEFLWRICGARGGT